MAKYRSGPAEKQSAYFDATQVLVNKEYFLEFFHVASANSVQFKGMITAFSDQYTSNWNSDPVYGRSDPIGIYKNTTRKLSISWDIVAASEGEAKDNLGRVSLLAKMLYPAYDDLASGASALATAPLLKLSFTNLVQNYGGDGPIDSPEAGSGSKVIKSGTAELGGLLGYIDGGVSITPDINNGFFDRAAGKLYPKSYKMSISFSVLHTHELGWSLREKKFRVRNFPYGEEFAGGADLSESPFKTKKTPGTDASQKARANKITKGK